MALSTTSSLQDSAADRGRQLVGGLTLTELPQMLSCTAAIVGSAGSRPIWRHTYTRESSY